MTYLPTTIHSTTTELAVSCPTCLTYGGPSLPGDPPEHDLATCPTCEVASVEWTLVTEIDAVLRELNGLDALDAALREGQ
ncbi:MAG TPA: hypothetical protein VES01_02135 [Dermatophilaceae bacterium]|nr:hypothetical protein [Dermatophilaceae bacterium]